MNQRERDEFERWMRSRGYSDSDLKTDANGTYGTIIQIQWNAWNARTAVEAQQSREREQAAEIERLRAGLHEVHALADGGESSMQEIVEICRAWLTGADRKEAKE